MIMITESNLKDYNDKAKDSTWNCEDYDSKLGIECGQPALAVEEYGFKDFYPPFLCPTCALKAATEE